MKPHKQNELFMDGDVIEITARYYRNKLTAEQRELLADMVSVFMKLGDPEWLELNPKKDESL